MKSIKKQFVLEGLCCGNCAVKIENDVNKLESVSFAFVDFVSKTLTVDIKDIEKLERLTQQAKGIVKRYDHNIIMIEKNSRKQAANKNNKDLKKAG